jgi:signal transduction histidine kinase
MNHAGETLTTKTVDKIIHPDDRDMIRSRRLKMMKGESVPPNFCCRIIDKEGATRWLAINSVLITWMGRPAILSFFNNITERKRAEQEVQAYQEQLRSLASELSLAEERERRRLATNLHDHIGQTLALTKIKLGALEAQLPSDGLSEELSSIRSLIDRTIKYTKSLTFELSPPILYELGFEATIEWLGEQVQKDHQLQFELRSDGKPKILDRDISVLMFQAVRELVMNIVKHAHAGKIRIAIYGADNHLHVDVEDDGVGFDPSQAGKGTFGFFSIRERFNRFNGTFRVESEPGRGTRASLTAPLSAKRRAARG